MKILTIVEEDRPGLLAEITTLLEQADVTVSDIDGDMAGKHAVLTLRAEPYGPCFEALTKAGIKVFSSDQLLVRIRDHPSALADLSRSLANEQVDVRSIHFIDKSEAQSIVALETTDPHRARQILRDILVREDT